VFLPLKRPSGARVLLVRCHGPVPESSEVQKTLSFTCSIPLPSTGFDPLRLLIISLYAKTVVSNSLVDFFFIY
jgi:hypothetical protein